MLLRIIDKISTLSGLLASWLIVPLIAVVCFDVFCRYLLNAPTIWAFDLGYMLTGSFFLLGGAFTLKENAHIREDILFSRFGPRTKVVVSMAAYLVFFLPVLTWMSISLGRYAWQAYVSGETAGLSAWNPPIWPFRLVFFVSFVLLLLQTLAEFVKAFSKLRSTPTSARER
jgi:TRAP-type mannitol/chloroaromatic compound transport system permease small subunit